MLNLSTIRRKIAGFISPEIIAEVAVLRGERRRAERLAMKDDLTSLANRRAFELASRQAEKTPRFSFVVFDLNNFKKINDFQNHIAGDKALINLARVLKTEAARIGFAERVFRIGGDEFAAIIPAELAAGFRQSVEKSFGVFYVQEFPVSVSGSIGANYAQADDILQNRKNKQKKEQLKNYEQITK